MRRFLSKRLHAAAALGLAGVAMGQPAASLATWSHATAPGIRSAARKPQGKAAKPARKEKPQTTTADGDWLTAAEGRKPASQAPQPEYFPVQAAVPPTALAKPCSRTAGWNIRPVTPRLHRPPHQALAPPSA